MTKDQIVAELVKRGAPKDRAILYADAYLEYSKASQNIDEYGLIVQHPRTGNPIQNPYLEIRRNAARTLSGMRKLQADFLW